mmetsp:Transcript_15567/g.27930  ORF Transcript_15567/g.27930 Transcript_15567/m.27930 type:complete len:476 (-) Transcript_15567:417-1844(-)
MCQFLCDDSRRFLSGDGLEIRPLERALDERFQRLSGIGVEVRLRVLLDVHAHSRPDRARAGQAEDGSGAVGHDEPDALLLRYRPVDRIRVLELAGLLELELLVVFEDFEVFAFYLVPHALEQHIARLLRASLVVVAGVVVPSILGPVRLRHRLHADELALFGVFVGFGEDRQPGEDGPDAVLLADVVGACAERLFSADGEISGVHEVSEVFPAGGDFVEFDLFLSGHKVDGSTRRHGPGAALEPVLEVRDALLRFVHDDRQRVGRRHEKLLAQNHVAVSVAVGCGAKLRHLLRSVFAEAHLVDEVVSVGEVRVRMAASEVLFRLAVQTDALSVHAEHFSEDFVSEGPSDAVHRVVYHAEVLAVGQFLHCCKVEDRSHFLAVLSNGVNYLDVHRSELVSSDFGLVEVRCFLGDFVRFNLLANRKDFVGQKRHGWPTVGPVILDTEVLVDPSRVVRSGQDDSAVSVEVSNERRDTRG